MTQSDFPTPPAPLADQAQPHRSESRTCVSRSTDQYPQRPPEQPPQPTREPKQTIPDQPDHHQPTAHPKHYPPQKKTPPTTILCRAARQTILQKTICQTTALQTAARCFQGERTA